MSWISLDFVELGEKYELYSEYPHHIRHKYKMNVLNGKIDKDGYRRFLFFKNGKRKHYSHHRLIYYALVEPFDLSNKNLQIDHVNHQRDDNRIENLRLVSASENLYNVSKHSSVKYNFVKELLDKVIVNELHKIYYSPSNDKFYRNIGPHYRELHECKTSKNCRQFCYRFEGKQYHIITSKWRIENGY